MKPFDLEKAKAGHPLVTRDGRKARFIAYVPECSYSARVVVHVEGICRVISYGDEGIFYIDGGTSISDLFLATVKREGWVNIYDDVDFTITSRVYDSEEEAEEYAREGKIASIKIEWEE